MFNWAFLIQLATLSSHGKSQSDSLAMEISMALSGVQEILRTVGVTNCSALVGI